KGWGQGRPQRMSVPPLATVPDRQISGARPLSSGGGGWWKLRTRSAPYLFLLPYILVTAVFFLYPVIYAMILAFYQTNTVRTRAYVGLDNFRFVLGDPDFRRAVWNTTVFAFFSICLQLPLSLGLAMLLNA